MAMSKVKNKFSFFSQVRILLKKIIKSNDSIDEVVDEHFRFSSSLSLDAPGGQIDNIYKDETNGIYHLSIYDNGLTGTAGIMPTAYTEWLIERKIRYNDAAPKAFLDMFDHRMYCLSYLAWQKMHLSGDEKKIDNNVLHNVLLSLAGITQHTVGLTGLAYTSFYAQSVRSLSGLEQMLSLLYQIPLTILPFHGTYEKVERFEQALLGDSQYSLGDAPVIGNVRWVVDSHFDVDVGPIDYNRALKFMQGGPFHLLIRQQIRSYIGATPEFNIRVLVHPCETDNKLKVDNKLGFNISIGSEIENPQPRCFLIT